MSCFIQIDIGDRDKFSMQQSAYEHSKNFYSQIGQKSLGLSGSLAGLDTEYLDLLKAAYEANPAWSVKVCHLTQRRGRSREKGLHALSMLKCRAHLYRYPLPA